MKAACSGGPSTLFLFDSMFYPPPVLFDPQPGYDALGATLRPRRGRSGMVVEIIPLVPL